MKIDKKYTRQVFYKEYPTYVCMYQIRKFKQITNY